MLKYLYEFIGSLVFFSVILNIGEPIPIGIALIAMIYFAGKISGGHFNPAVSFMMYIQNKMTDADFVFHLVAQLVGAYLAVYLYRNSKLLK
jgi:glycerol uptake facilitator-like aquaporin